MSKHNNEHRSILKRTKHFFAGQLNGRFVGARVKQQIAYVTTLFTLTALLFAAAMGNAWARPDACDRAPLGCGDELCGAGGLDSDQYRPNYCHR